MIDNKKLGIVVLFVGVLLLVFTFFNAYVFLQEDFVIISTSGLVDLFGEALGPLIGTCIRVMYLAIMGWISSVLTIRGVQLLNKSMGKKDRVAEPQTNSETKKGRSATPPSKRVVKGTRNE